MQAVKDRQLLPFIFWLFIALLAFTAVSVMAPLDQSLVQLIALSQPLPQTPGQTFLVSLPALLSGVGAIYIGQNLLSINRTMALLQITCLSLTVQWFLLQNFKFSASPVSVIFTVVAGVILGAVLKRQSEEQTKMQTNLMQLQMTNDEIASTRLAMIKQDEADRRLLAADLHDLVLNDLKQAKAKLSQTTPSQDGEQMLQLMDQCANQIRTVMENLTPSVLENLGLISALEELLRQANQKSNLRTRLDHNQIDTLNFDAIEELLIYRIVQEVLNNTIKHAGAKQVTLKIEKTENLIIISITDDGKGIDPEKERGASRGLRYIRQRADILGAIASWQSGKDNKGTTFKLQLPIRGL